MEYVFEAKGLVKRYGNYTALSGFDMHVPKGAIYGFVGRNGAGKTTLIRILCGIQPATSGDFTLYGKSGKSNEIHNARRRMGAIVESPAIYMDMTAQQNLCMQCRVLGIPTTGVNELLALVGLSNTGKKKARDFSLGMRQRLGIAIALVGDPDLLVLDEPVNGLDPQGIIEIRELIQMLNKDHGITVIISSHYLDELSKVATHYGFIDQGKMVREMSMEMIEKACKKSLKVKVSDIDALSRVLVNEGMDHIICSENEAEIYTDVEITGLVHALDCEKCKLLSAKENEEDLESFYINLIGGEYHA